MKILRECCIPAKSLSRTSIVIINWLTAGQIEDEFLSRHNYLGIRALAYPEGVKGVRPPLNVFHCCLHRNALKLCSCVHYILNFVHEYVKLHTNANFTFLFRVCFILLRPRPMVRSPFRKFLIYHLWTPSIVNLWVRLCHRSISNVWFRPWFRPGPYWELIALPQNP